MPKKPLAAMLLVLMMGATPSMAFDAAQLQQLLTTKNCPGCDLSYADLRNADLRNADLRNANLTGADLTGADLTGADLTGANTTNAVVGNQLWGDYLNLNHGDNFANGNALVHIEAAP